MSPTPAAGPRLPTASSAGRCRRLPRAPSGGPATSSTSPTPTQLERWPWPDHDLVLNAAAYTAVDARRDGRRAAHGLGRRTPASRPPWPGWRPSTASRSCTTRPTTSSTAPRDDARRGRAAVAARGLRPDEGRRRRGRRAPSPRHYLLRTSWVVGDGANFVRTMARAGRRGRRRPSVVADQIGRLTFADELARATRHLLDDRRAVRHLPRHQRRPADVVGRRGARGLRPARPRPGDVRAVTTEEYVAGRTDRAAAGAAACCRLRRIEATGFEPRDAREALRAYASSLP